MVKNRKNCRILVFDSSKRPSGRTECNAKNLSSQRSTIFEKIKKNHQKCPKMGNFEKNGHFWRFFLILAKMVLR